MPDELYQAPQMCLYFQGIDFDTEEVKCGKGHRFAPDDFRCFDNKCPDYQPDGVDLTNLTADILSTLRGHGRAMTDDEITTHVMLKEYGRRSQN